MMKKLVISLFVMMLAIPFVFGQKTSFLIDIDKTYIDGNEAIFKEVGGGDTLLFASGNRPFLLIKNFHGNPNHPIVMINSGGDVIIDTDHYFGISIQNCRYFKITGTGDSTQTYGFKIKRVANGAGIGIGGLSSDYELDHFSIENCKSAGIFAKTDPDCSLMSVRGTFTQYNTLIHNNYISNVGVEGMYVGSTKFFGQTVHCNGKDTLLLPSLLDGVKIYNNTIQYSGWDGIQVSSASNNCQIYNNTILFDSQQDQYAQMSGIIIGGGSKCDCYNNFIAEGKGNGIEGHGLGGYRIFNNIIVNAGRNFKTNDLNEMKHGIFVTDVSVQNDSSIYIQHNTIINPKSDGIRFSSVKSRNNLIASNVIINPGNFDYYENGNTRFKGKDAYIMFQNIASEATIRNNYLDRNASAAGFSSQNPVVSDDFKLIANSPLIDAADVDRNIPFDFSGLIRPQGTKYDIGAFEFEDLSSQLFVQPNTQDQEWLLLENPVKDQLRILLPNGWTKNNLVVIYDLNGHVISKVKMPDLITENNIVHINLGTITSGIYFFRIISDKISLSGKFMKL